MIRSKIDKPAKPSLAIVHPTDDPKKLWHTYSELEPDIRDLERMALLAVHHVEEDKEWTDRETYEDMRSFLVYDILRRAADLRKKYDEGFGDPAVRS